MRDLVYNVIEKVFLEYEWGFSFEHPFVFIYHHDSILLEAEAINDMLFINWRTESKLQGVKIGRWWTPEFQNKTIEIGAKFFNWRKELVVVGLDWASAH